jgi:large subunit ribosomal protein L14
MIQTGSLVNVSDNSGARIACCLKVLNGYRRRYAKIGDVIVVSIKKLRAKRKAQSRVQKGSVMRAVILRTKVCKRGQDGISFNFSENSVALISNKGRPIGTRIIGSLPKTLRYSKYMRMVSISAGLIK